MGLHLLPLGNLLEFGEVGQSGSGSPSDGRQVEWEPWIKYGKKFTNRAGM